MKALLYKLLNRRGIIFYLLFNVYLIFLHPSLITRVSEAAPSNPDPLLGWIFLLLPFMELIGFWLKYPMLRYYVHSYANKRSNWTIMIIILLPIFHLAMSAFLFIVGSQIAGIQPGNDAAWYWQLLWVIGLFLVIIKEMGFLLFFFSFGGMNWTGNQKYPPNVLFLKRLRIIVQDIQLKHLLEDTLGDLLLLVFSTLGYTALWEYTGMISPFDTHADLGDMFFQIIGVSIYFLMVVPPLQAVYLLQESLVRTTKRQKLWSGFQYALTFISAFLSIIRS